MPAAPPSSVMNSRRLMCFPHPRIAPYHTVLGKAALCITANLAANVSVGSFATGPSPHPVELCLLCPPKRKSYQGLGICHDGLWRVDDAATSFNAQAFSNSPSGNLAPMGATSSCCSMRFPGHPVAAGKLPLAGWPAAPAIQTLDRPRTVLRGHFGAVPPSFVEPVSVVERPNNRLRMMQPQSGRLQ